MIRLIRLAARDTQGVFHWLVAIRLVLRYWRELL